MRDKLAALAGAASRRPLDERALIERLWRTSPIALELLAYEHLNSPTLEAQRVAALHRRALSEFPRALGQLLERCTDAATPPASRLALAAVLHGVGDTLEDPTKVDASRLLEAVVLLHALLGQLEPLLPAHGLRVELEEILDLLCLAIPEPRRERLLRDFKAVWLTVHRLARAAPPAEPAEPAEDDALDQLAEGSHEQLLALIDARPSGGDALPAPPRPSTPSWARAWLEDCEDELPTLHGLPASCGTRTH